MCKALIAMSGGVDSSVAASLMLEAGFDCIGATMLLCDNALLGQPETVCNVSDGIADAQRIAGQLGMPFYVFDTTAAFREKVVDRFIEAYEAGLTPNPCVQCNQHIKFTDLLERALELDCSHVVTGHYARIVYDEITGRHLLYKAKDLSKDQSYFLAGLTQHQLAHARFPLGELTKDQVRLIAEQRGFVNARKRDSQDICFVPDGDYKAFMERYTGKQYESGTFLDMEGNVVGKHSGAVGYTLGQRKGLGLAMGQPVYVCGKDMEKNTVTVGPDEALYATTLLATDWNWIPFRALRRPMRILAKARSRHTEQPAMVYPEENGSARVVFDEPQRAITPGQAVVLYDGELVVGSGTIVSAE